MDFNYIYCNMTASSSKINLVNVEGKGEIINMFYINAFTYPFPVNNSEPTICSRLGVYTRGLPPTVSVTRTALHFPQDSSLPNKTCCSAEYASLFSCMSA